MNWPFTALRLENSHPPQSALLYIHRLTSVFRLPASLCDSIQAANILLHTATTNAVTDVAHFSSVREGVHWPAEAAGWLTRQKGMWLQVATSPDTTSIDWTQAPPTPVPAQASI